MYRAGIELLLGFGLILIQAFIVMQIKDSSTINLGTNGQFVAVWVINSLLTFAILTDIKNWISKQGNSKVQQEL